MAYFNRADHADKEIDQFLSDKDNPVAISFISPKTNFPVTYPIWTIYESGKFYLFTGKKNLKVQAIESGKDRFSLTVINKTGFPYPPRDGIPYVTVSGKAIIQTFSDLPNVAEIEIRLLEKYNAPEEDWIDQLIESIKKDPKKAWLIEITPKTSYIYNWS